MKDIYEKVIELRGRRLVISECGHGYRSTRCEGPNWAGQDIVDFKLESSVETMLDYVKTGRIKVDKALIHKHHHRRPLHQLGQ